MEIDIACQLNIGTTRIFITNVITGLRVNTDRWAGVTDKKPPKFSGE